MLLGCIGDAFWTHREFFKDAFGMLLESIRMLLGCIKYHEIRLGRLFCSYFLRFIYDLHKVVSRLVGMSNFFPPSFILCQRFELSRKFKAKKINGIILINQN